MSEEKGTQCAASFLDIFGGLLEDASAFYGNSSRFGLKVYCCVVFCERTSFDSIDLIGGMEIACDCANYCAQFRGIFWRFYGSERIEQVVASIFLDVLFLAMDASQQLRFAGAVRWYLGST